MTWSLNASGHHNTNDWKAEEYELLREFVNATQTTEQVEGKNVTSTFRFNGNHVQAESVDDALAKLEAYDNGAESSE